MFIASLILIIKAKVKNVIITKCKHYMVDLVFQCDVQWPNQ